MEWVIIFDFVRHLFEFFFFLIAGPLVSFFAYKKATYVKSEETQLLELQKSLLELALRNQDAFKNKIIPLISGLDVNGGDNLALPGGKK